MKKALIHQLFTILLTAVVVTGCYKDKGNYDYKELNKVTIEADVTGAVSVLLQDTLTINTTITETIPSTGGYDYEWVLYQNIGAPITRWALATTKNLKAQITQTPGTYKLDYFMKDKASGISYLKSFTINIVGKFNEGWLVIEEEGGACDLSMIAPNDAIFRAIYSSANKNHFLPVGSHRVTVVRDRLGVQKVYVLSPNEFTQPYFVDFLKVGSFNDQFWGPPSIKKPQEYFIEGSSNEVMLNNGYPFGMTTMVPAPYKLNLQAPGTWDLEPYSIYTTSSGFVFYDKLSQRFYKYNLTDLFPFAAPPSSAVFNVNNVGKKMLFAGAGTGQLYNCIFKNNNDDSVFAFTMNPSLTNPAIDTAFIPAANAPGLVNATKFISSKLLPHVYYVNGNQLYLLDIPARRARVVFTFPAGTEVASMKLHVNLKNGSDVYQNKQIAVAANEGSNGKVYLFTIEATGDFTGNTYRKLYTGFAKLNDIALKWAP
ncbi:PKD-like family lipoprotein [Lacibacter luteus]|nr:PKD-like family lipoprotein [Lacibacter luteus]